MRVSTWRAGFWMLSLYVSDTGERYCMKCEPAEFCTLPRRLAREFFSGRQEDAMRQCHEWMDAAQTAYLLSQRAAG